MRDCIEKPLEDMGDKYSVLHGLLEKHACENDGCTRAEELVVSCSIDGHSGNTSAEPAERPRWISRWSRLRRHQEFRNDKYQAAQRCSPRLDQGLKTMWRGTDLDERLRDAVARELEFSWAGKRQSCLVFFHFSSEFDHILFFFGDRFGAHECVKYDPGLLALSWAILSDYPAGGWNLTIPQPASTGSRINVHTSCFVASLFSCFFKKRKPKHHTHTVHHTLHHMLHTVHNAHHTPQTRNTQSVKVMKLKTRLNGGSNCDSPKHAKCLVI